MFAGAVAVSSSSDVSIIELSQEFVEPVIGPPDGPGEGDLLTGDTVETGVYRGGAQVWGMPGEGAGVQDLHTSPGHTQIHIREKTYRYKSGKVNIREKSYGPY